jgi:alkanesulfonate monooxygenase SsuD/methylene tetrahydromethanopterin reductase-like flavin-dependent oxidoreductase (luciferase family)
VVPTAVTTLTEPFHLASALSTLDFVSRGRAGWRPQVSGRRSDAAHVGRRELPTLDPTRLDDPVHLAVMEDLFEEAADAVEVVRRLWDSWEDDAIIKDQATGRYIDRDKLHYVDFEGRFFNVKGPSIVPRPPQGNPLIAALAHSQRVFEFAATSADVVFVTPRDTADVSRLVGDVRTAEQAVARTGEPLRIFGDLNVFLAATTAEAEERKQHLDQLDGAPFRSDAATFVGTPGDLAEQLLAWQQQGLVGFRVRPGVIDHDLDAIVDGLVPALQARGSFRSQYAEQTLRARLGLHRPISRYATAGSTA